MTGSIRPVPGPPRELAPKAAKRGETPTKLGCHEDGASVLDGLGSGRIKDGHPPLTGVCLLTPASLGTWHLGPGVETPATLRPFATAGIWLPDVLGTAWCGAALCWVCKAQSPSWGVAVDMLRNLAPRLHNRPVLCLRGVTCWEAASAERARGSGTAKRRTDCVEHCRGASDRSGIRMRCGPARGAESSRLSSAVGSPADWTV